MKRIDWVKWSAIAEIFSGIAVVLTLIMLILGVQENTEVTRASMFDRSIESMNEFRRLIVSDPDAARYWQAFGDDEMESLDRIDRTRAEQLVLLIFGIYEKAYFAREYDVMGSAEWERFETQICRQFNKARFSSELMEVLDRAMTPAFVAYVQDQCGE